MHSLPLLEPIECADWCADGDGHAAAVMRGDQVCWGFESYTSLALEPSDIADGVRFDSRIGVMPRRRYHRQPEVYVHLDLDRHDVDVRLTASEARRFAADLVSVAATIEGRS